MGENVKRRKTVSPPLLIIAGFMLAVILGGLLLSLPISSREGRFTPPNEALFTAVSAVCVTGLVVKDTATYWSYFGQAVILVLIQIGGLGVVTVAASFTILAGKKLSIVARSTMQNAVSAPEIGGIVKLTEFILKGAFIVEGAGFLMLLPGFIRRYGTAGIWPAAFHSVSAFCNAGFDLMGSRTGPFSSLTAFSGDALVSVPIMLLIVIGGIGFLTWDDVVRNGFRLSRYRMQSKVILSVSGILLIVPAVYFFLFEFKDIPLGERALLSLFAAVTPRTAGFNTADLNGMNGVSKALTTALMLIGGSPGSTAGGMKTTTLAILFSGVVSTFRKREDVHFFGRRVNPSALRNASTILVTYLSLFAIGAMAISLIEGLPLSDCLFETASAIGTVGLTLGITTKLGIVSQIILMLLMFLGRVGGLTLVYAILPGNGRINSKLPLESITVG